MSAAAWTAADAAELDLLIWELLGALEEHRGRCPRCQAERRSGWPCPRVTEAVEAVLEWRRRRGLLSSAEHLRRRRVRGYLAELQEGLAA